MIRIENQEGNPANLSGRAMQLLERTAGTLGLDDAQTQAKLDQLFSAYPGEWSIFFLTGASSAITAALTTDTTLPWLDTDVSGQTLRQLFINRLS